MNSAFKLFLFFVLSLALASCVTKKDYELLQTELATANKDLSRLTGELASLDSQIRTCQSELRAAESGINQRDIRIADLREQIADLRRQRDAQLAQVEGLTSVSESANQNVQQTLGQLAKKDKYIQMLQAAKTRTDSINLALAVNLKGVLDEGLSDEDVEVKVDKTVVYVDLSDKVLFQSGSAELSPRANEILGKIATIVKSRPNLEVMVEGHTDSVPISTPRARNNWELSVLRATAVVQMLKNNHGIDPSRLVAAGRGEFQPIAENTTEEGRARNRRTRIIILPKLNEFFDLLDPNQVPE